tara:strand:- start:11363 stop:13330 length:1968 start_codon:yes stop_codon:yes gene_type:complete
MAILDFLFGRTKAVPTTTQVQSRSTLPSEIAPFATEVLEEAQQLYGERRGEGYQEFPGETIAPRTQQELDAIAGLRGLVGTQEPYRAEEEARIRATPTAFTSEQAETFMNPYQQSVIDVAKRKAQEDFEQRVMPQFEAQAISAGGMSGLGTRAAVQAAELGRGFQEQLSDIQTIGQQKAFEDAYSRFGDQINRERTKAADISNLGQQRFNIGLAEQGLAQQLAQDDRSEAQAILADQFAEFTEREQFPEKSLAQYSSFVYGNPFLSQVDRGATTTSQLQPTTSTAQQLLGLGLTGLQTAGRGGAFSDGGFSLANLFRQKKGGGSVGGGLDSLPLIRRKHGRSVYNPGRFGAVSARKSREAQEAISRLAALKQLGIQGTTDEATIKDIVKKDNLAKTLQRKSQATAREGLTARNLKKLSAGADKTFGPDFGRAAKAVIDASPTQGLVGLLGLAGAEAFEGQDIKVKERDKLKRDIAKIESNLTAADLAARQAGETSGTAEASAENIRAAEAASKLARDKITEGTRSKDQARKVVKEEVGIEKNMMDMESTYLKAMKDNKATPDQNPATLKQQGLNEVLGRFNYTIDAQGKLAFIGKDAEALREDSPAYKKVLNARDKYNTAFAKYLNDARKARGSLTYLDANNAALFAAKAAKTAQ